VIYHVSWQFLAQQDLATKKDLQVLPKDDQVNPADCTRLKQCVSLHNNPAVFLDLNKGDIPPMQKQIFPIILQPGCFPSQAFF
jgi:ABC-type Zn uptake system ZnuABC Zn-binding protein ZnuA